MKSETYHPSQIIPTFPFFNFLILSECSSEGCPFSVNLESFDKYIINSQNTIHELNNLVKNCEVDRLGIRFDIWRIYLGVLNPKSALAEKRCQLETSRSRFDSLCVKHIKKQQPTKPKPANDPLSKINKNNPLAMALTKTTAPVTTPNDDKFLHEQILKDVQRTYQERSFFVNSYISKLLTKVLFVWSKENPDISYKQGINEVGASVIYTYFQSAVTPNKSYPEFDNYDESIQHLYQFFHSTEFAEADIYAVFEKMMDSGHKEMFRLESDKKESKLNPNSKNNNPILQRIARLADVSLKIVDLELFRHIKLQEVQMRTFLLRWIRCIHTREFELEDSFTLWDNIFLERYQETTPSEDFQFIDCTCLAMLIYLRDIALTKERGYEVLQLYQKYPKVEGAFLKELVLLAWKVKDILDTPPANAESSETEKKKKDLFFLEKGFADRVRRQEIERNKQKATKYVPAPVDEKEMDKETHPIFYNKKSSEPEAPKSAPVVITNGSNHAPSFAPQTPVVIKQQIVVPATMVIPPPSPVTPILKPNITLSWDEWKEVEKNLKKSIDENTDIESKALAMKVLKLLQNKEQEQLKK